MIEIQTQMSERAVELLNLPEDQPCYLLDVGYVFMVIHFSLGTGSKPHKAVCSALHILAKHKSSDKQFCN